MILSDDEIIGINQTAEFDSAIGYARAIEAKVLEKLSDKLRDAERYRWLTKYAYIGECYTESGVILEVQNCDRKVPSQPYSKNSCGYSVDQAIDAAIKESK